MRTILVVTAVLSFIGVSLAADGSVPSIPPVKRSERHFGDGEGYLRALPDGTKITFDRLDGTRFELLLQNGVLKGALPAAKISTDARAWTSPLGYVLAVDPGSSRVTVKSPSGTSSTIMVLGKRIMCVNPDGDTWWNWRERPQVMRLLDGTRIDIMEDGNEWEAVTLRGERARLSLESRTWRTLDPIPSPPLIPEVESFFPAGNGSKWRRPAREDHIVFAWNWYPVGLPLARAIDDVKKGARRLDLDGYFAGIPQPQPAEESAGVIVARRFALFGGDRITFEPPGGEPYTVFLVPGGFEPDYYPYLERIPNERSEPLTGGS